MQPKPDDTTTASKRGCQIEWQATQEVRSTASSRKQAAAPNPAAILTVYVQTSLLVYSGCSKSDPSAAAIRAVAEGIPGQRDVEVLVHLQCRERIVIAWRCVTPTLRAGHRDVLGIMHL